MADNITLNLTCNGQAIAGETTITSQGRDTGIEVLSYKDGVETAREKGSARATGRRTYKPIEVTMRCGKQTPLIAKALCNNEKVTAEFKFFRPNPGGDGTQEHYLTIKIDDGRVSHIERQSEDTLNPALAERPPTETVGFVFHTVVWTYVIDGIEHEDRWDNA